MAEKPSWVAKTALVATFVTFAFTTYQSNETNYQGRVDAAIDLSKTYLQDVEFSNRLNLFVKNTKMGLINNDDYRERSYVDFLDYVSTLANNGLIENRYLAGRIKCDIAYVSKEVKAKRPDLINAIKNSSLFVANEKDVDCPDHQPR